jgi:serine phosphatase RsbU (regulator of sigma subunit)
MNASIRQLGIHPLTLQFLGDQEKAFQRDYFTKSINHLRFSLGLAILLYALFGILDYLLIPEVKEQIWVIRYAIVCPYLILYLLLTWNHNFIKFMQPSLVLAVLVTGFGIVAMSVIAYPPGSYYYYAGLILVLMWSYTFTATRFVYATLAGWMLVVAYEFAAFLWIDTPLPVLISNNFFFLSANLIGMLACYLIEYYKRRDFWQRSLIEEERAKSESILLKIQDELALASDIQTSLLPSPSLHLPGVEIICFTKPTLEIGGDFYSYHVFEDGRLALAMGDVSGKGIPAALLMAASLSLFDATFTLNLSPSERLIRLDQELAPYTEPQHQNCAFCYLELEQQDLQIVNAGGIPPYIRHTDGLVEWPRVSGFPLGYGLGENSGYQSTKMTLSVGDLIILVSDGIVECKDQHNTMFSFNRLEQTIATGPGESAQAMLDYLTQEIAHFTEATELHDDCTIVILRLTA